MFMCFSKCSSVMNSIYSGQELFSYNLVNNLTHLCPVVWPTVSSPK
jgi:hypothetical protein